MIKQVRKTLRGSAGFTLVELVVVIAVLGILAGVGTVGYSGYIQRANEAVDDTLYHDIIYAGAIGYSYTGARGSVEVDKEGAAVHSGDEAIIGKWMEDAFGRDWQTTVKYKTDTFANDPWKNVIYLPGSSSADSIVWDDESESMLDKVNDSNYSGNEEELMNTVDKLADALANKADLVNVLAALDSEGYKTYMEEMYRKGYVLKDGDTYTVKPGMEDEFANASVLYIASQYQTDENYNADTALESLKNALNSSGTTIPEMYEQFAGAGNNNGLAGAALAYALTLGYANSGFVDEDTAASIKNQASNGVTGLSTMMNFIASVNGQPGFKDYLDSADAKSDIDGYFGAMQLLNKYGDKIDITIDDAYGNGAMSLIQAILNGK